MQQMLLGAGAKKDDPLYLDDVFNTSLWTGTTAKRNIPSGIKLDHGNYSVEFDGNDSLSIPDDHGWEIGTKDFTFEAWIYPDNWDDTYMPIFVVAVSTGLWVGKLSSNFVVHGFNGSTQLTYGTLPTTGQWTHIAVSRSGNSLKLFYNGTAVATDSSNSYGFDDGGTVYIGNDSSSNYFDGKISNLRLITKNGQAVVGAEQAGQALYTSDFTSPTEAITLSSQGASPAKVVLLCCNTAFNVGGSKAGDGLTITANGDPTASTSSPFSADSSTYGGLVWIKCRDEETGCEHVLFDTERGWGQKLSSSSNAGQPGANTGTLTNFNIDGFCLAHDTEVNHASDGDYVGWTFKKEKKFMDIQTWTGTDSTQVISHDLGSVPGCILVKAYSQNGKSWKVYHRGLNNGSSPEDYSLELNSTDNIGSASNQPWDNTAPTATGFTVSGASSQVNGNGISYVAYIFAHDAGGFGEAGDQSVIKCGYYTGDGTSDGSKFIDMGFEPGWFMVKCASGSTQEWMMFDSMRGLIKGEAYQLMANENDAEGGATSFNVTSTGIEIWNSNNAFNGNSNQYIYIAIAKGTGKNMRTPSSGHNVLTLTDFNGGVPAAGYTASVPYARSHFPVDFSFYKNTVNGSGDWDVFSRIQGKTHLRLSSNSNDPDATANDSVFDYSDGWSTWNGGTNHFVLNFKRYSGLDICSYKGNATAGREVSHQLGQTPQMIWIKNRGMTRAWAAYHFKLNGGSSPEDYFIRPNGTGAEEDSSQYWNDTAPTSSVFTLGFDNEVNDNNKMHVAILFSSVEGVSKLGEWSGTGSSHTITTGFRPKLLIVKCRTHSHGWVVLSTKVGWEAGNDGWLFMQDNGGVQTGEALGGPTATGFTVDGDYGPMNESGKDYIYYAHA